MLEVLVARVLNGFLVKGTSFMDLYTGALALIKMGITVHFNSTAESMESSINQSNVARFQIFLFYSKRTKV